MASRSSPAEEGVASPGARSDLSREMAEPDWLPSKPARSYCPQCRTLGLGKEQPGSIARLSLRIRRALFPSPS